MQEVQAGTMAVLVRGHSMEVEIGALATAEAAAVVAAVQRAAQVRITLLSEVAEVVETGCPITLQE